MSGAKAGCTDPVIGERLSERLGGRLDGELARHVEGCLACRVEVAAFEVFFGGEASVSGEMRRRLERLVGSSWLGRPHP